MINPKNRRYLNIIFIFLIGIFIWILYDNKRRLTPTFDFFPGFVYIEHIFATFLLCWAFFQFIRIFCRHLRKEVAYYASFGTSVGINLAASFMYDFMQYMRNPDKLDINQLLQIPYNFIGIWLFVIYMQFYYEDLVKLGQMKP